MSTPAARPTSAPLFDVPEVPEPATIEGRFARFHAAHPEVYLELARLARQMRVRGFERYSIKGLFEIVRFNRLIGKGPGDDFALNNDYSAIYARLLMEQEPDLDGFFATRERRTR